MESEPGIKLESKPSTKLESAPGSTLGSTSSTRENTKLVSKQRTRTSTRLESKTNITARSTFRPPAPHPIATIYQRVEERLISFRTTFLCLLQTYFDIVVTFACTHVSCTFLSVVSNLVPRFLCLLTRRILVSSAITTAFLPSSHSFPVDSLPLCYKSGGGRKLKSKTSKTLSNNGSSFKLSTITKFSLLLVQRILQLASKSSNLRSNAKPKVETKVKSSSTSRSKPRLKLALPNALTAKAHKKIWHQQLLHLLLSVIPNAYNYVDKKNRLGITQ